MALRLEKKKRGEDESRKVFGTFNGAVVCANHLAAGKV
jgi:hypothetical protein